MALDQILIVGHESKMVHLLRQLLTTAGFAVMVTHKGERAVQIAAEGQPILLISEYVLPDGCCAVDLLNRLREFSDIPVIILSEQADAENILRSFKAGADDYVSKPFDARILLARIRAVLRRSPGRVGMAEISCQDLLLNLAARQVTLNGQPVYLTETEYNLLLELARHRDQVMLHEQLLVRVWGPKFGKELDYLRSYIHMLRRKLEKTPSQPRLIISRPGIGYMLVSNPAESDDLNHGN